MTTTPKTLTVLECHQLLDAILCKKGTGSQFEKGIRNYCMALLMLDAGLRVGEVVALTMSDLFYNNKPVISVRIGAAISKTKEERTVPLSSRIRNALGEYIKRWHWLADPEINYYAFCTSFGVRHLTTRQVERIISAAALKSIGRPIHAHVLRHTFASRLMRTVNARIVQELLGHKHMTSTQIYTHPNQEDLKKAIDSLPAIQQAGAYDSFLSAPDTDFPDSTDAAAADSDVR